MEVISREDAREKGLKFYFTGKPCKRGHISARFICSKNCIICHSDRNKAECAGKLEEWKESTKGPEYVSGKKTISRVEALSQKLSLYFTGRFCDRGHLCERFTVSGDCVNCNRERCIERYRGNKAEYYTRNTVRERMQECAIPLWYNESLLNGCYEKRDILSEQTGIAHECDHIVPLNSAYVCGLHWHGNIQVITKTENLSKGNRYWPDMPDISDPELQNLVNEYKINSTT